MKKKKRGISPTLSQLPYENMVRDASQRDYATCSIKAKEHAQLR